jgi:CheY-like chemotaxis protein
MQILIADDESSILAVLQLFFRQAGYEVTTARDGQEALDRVRANPPDLVIFDIQMPRKTGIQAITELRAIPHLAHIPAIALTAFVRDFLPPAVLEAGFDKLITKPFELLELREEVQQMLTARAYSGEQSGRSGE